MTRWIKKTVLFSLSIAVVVQLSACGSGGPDNPFIFGGDDEPGSPSESEDPPPSTSCTTNTDCTAPQTCDLSTHTCKSPVTGVCVPSCSTGQVCDAVTNTCRTVNCTDDPTICNSATQKCENSVCVCDSTKTTCGLSSGACEVDFNATIGLIIDDGLPPGNPGLEGHYDSPSTCEQYSGSDGFNGPLDPASLENFLQPPSENVDVYCCSEAQEESGFTTTDPYGNEIYCAENRHGGTPELAATRFSPPSGKKVKLKFAISSDGSSCQVALLTDEFPDYHLENTVLDASMIIDAGKDYQTVPGSFPRRLNDAESIGSCQVTVGADGNVQVAITSLPLRFMVQLYKNSVKCVEVDDEGDACPTPFTVRYNGESSGSYQIIPGFGSDASPNQPLLLTTGTKTQAPIVPAHQIPFEITGSPLHYDAASEKTRMSLVTTLVMPPLDTSRDDELGTGQLLAQLGDAILTAEIRGTVTKQNGQPIQTLADLTTGCGGGSGGGQTLEMGMRTTFDTVQDEITVSGTPTDSTQPISGEACVPGQHADGSCQFFETANLPFAKDTVAGDPLPGTEAKFVKEGTLRIENKGTSGASVTLQVPEKSGAFRILNYETLQNITLAPGNIALLNVRFEPEVGASGCTTSGAVVDCQAAMQISSSHSVTVNFKGRAKIPAAEVRLEELEVVSPFATVGDALIPGTASPSVDFGEATVGVETKTRLYKISNAGVRNLVVTGIRSQDVDKNFRVGSVYQGADFEGRTWRIRGPWTVSPSGTDSVFFFLNHGPFGRVTDRSSEETCGHPSDQPTRCNTASLVIAMSEVGNRSVNLSGKATRDTRAVMELYVQDEKKFLVTGDDDNPSDFSGTEHLYLAKRPLDSGQIFSFRQDPVGRAVYLRNGSGASSQLDSLVLTALPTLGGTNPDNFTFTTIVTATPEAPLVIAPNAIVKIGDIGFAAVAGDSYQKFLAALQVAAVSQPPTVGSASRLPVVGGYFDEEGGLDKSHAAGSVNFGIGRVTGALQGLKDLRVHRLFAGFDNPLVAQATRMVSSVTRGITSRAELSGSEQNQYTEIYTLDSKLDFNAENGTVSLNPVFTPVDSTSPTSSVPGIRLFNGPGSSPVFQYHFQCVKGGGQCGFFYLDIGDWSSTSRLCDGKPPVSADPGDNTPPAALDPRVPADATCMQDPVNGIAPAAGLYDPVTGEVTFKDLAIRLFSPETPSLSGDNRNLDATIRIALSTECITSELVPDSNAQAMRLIPTQTLNEPLEFVTNSGFPNPLTEYVGDSCADPREMHGRRMGEPDTTGTLDNMGALAVGSYNFDLVAVGKVKAGSITTSAPFTQANKMMYIVIKAEVGDF